MLIGVFDRIATGSGGTSIELVVRCDLCSPDDCGYSFDLLEAGSQTAGEFEYRLTAVLEGGREYTYAEVIREVHDQNQLLLTSIALDWISGSPIGTGSETGGMRIDRVVLNEALLWPSMMNLAVADSTCEIRYRARIKECDLWMF